MEENQADGAEKESKEKPFYDRLYAAEKSAFGGPESKPEQFVEYLGEVLPHGVVLELGAGQGRNALWLARRGMSVEASDISVVGVEQMKAAAQAESLPLIASVADVRAPILKEYHAIISTYVLQHILKEEAEAVLRDVREHTKPGGYNVLAVFTMEGDFYAKNPATPNWYPPLGALKELYAGWEIIRYEESVRKALAKKEDGTPMMNTVARIVARKK